MKRSFIGAHLLDNDLSLIGAQCNRSGVLCDFQFGCSLEDFTVVVGVAAKVGSRLASCKKARNSFLAFLETKH
jgi:hypothetical protein